VFKNLANQKVAVYARNVVTDQPYTGGAATITAQYSKDGAACGATTDENPTELDAVDTPGIYIFDFADAGDSNADMIVLSAVSTTANIQIEPLIIYTQTVMRGTDSAALATVCTEVRLARLDATVSSTVAATAAAVLDAASAAHLGAGTIGAKIASSGAHIDVDFRNISVRGD